MRAARWSPRRTRRSPLGAVLALVAIAVLALAFAWLTPPGEALSGRAFAVDGDTLKIGATRIRLIGLDAVELDQTCTGDGGETWRCGEAARAFVAETVGKKPVACARQGRDRYGRILANCRVGGVDLGQAIVQAGWAVADLEYGLALADARIGRRGIWSGSFDDPREWRRHHGADGFDFWGWLLGLINR